MLGRQTGDQSQLFYLFNIEAHSSVGHLLLRTTGRARDGRTILYRASKLECDVCALLLAQSGRADRLRPPPQT
jgi:hypothetical protein